MFRFFRWLAKAEDAIKHALGGPYCDFCWRKAEYSDGVALLACKDHAHLID